MCAVCASHVHGDMRPMWTFDLCLYQPARSPRLRLDCRCGRRRRRRRRRRTLLFVCSFSRFVWWCVSLSCWVPASCSHAPSPRDPPLPSPPSAARTRQLGLFVCLFVCLCLLSLKPRSPPKGVSPPHSRSLAPAAGRAGTFGREGQGLARRRRTAQGRPVSARAAWSAPHDHDFVP